MSSPVVSSSLNWTPPCEIGRILLEATLVSGYQNFRPLVCCSLFQFVLRCCLAIHRIHHPLFLELFCASLLKPSHSTSFQILSPQSTTEMSLTPFVPPDHSYPNVYLELFLSLKTIHSFWFDFLGFIINLSTPLIILQ